nr:7TM diverse intracellular signaling domain-containing protein [Desulfolutivibrio sulfoxidireducens]
MTVYHFAIYFLKKRDVSSLYFGFGCIVLITAFMTLDSSDWLINLFVPNSDPAIISNIPIVAYAVLASVLYRFYRSIYQVEFIAFVQHVCDIKSIVFVFIILT